MHGAPERVQRLHDNARLFVSAARRAGLDVGASESEAIVPIMTGSSIRAVALSQHLFQRDINVQPIIYPAIPERLARLRFFLSSEHTPENMESSVAIIAEELALVSATSPAALARGSAGL
jgi:7-keto-8-aminopelargonate synthetase-like enzyme